MIRLTDQALRGYVFAPVGNATHYHTDWVVPYWSSSLDKIVAVGTSVAAITDMSVGLVARF